MSANLFRAKAQPATKFRIMGIGIERHNPKSSLYASCCKRSRIAANLVAHAYYDDVWFYCRKGKGCKS